MSVAVEAKTLEGRVLPYVYLFEVDMQSYVQWGQVQVNLLRF